MRGISLVFWCSVHALQTAFRRAVQPVGLQVPRSRYGRHELVSCYSVALGAGRWALVGLQSRHPTLAVWCDDQQYSEPAEVLAPPDD